MVGLLSSGIGLSEIRVLVQQAADLGQTRANAFGNLRLVRFEIVPRRDFAGRVLDELVFGGKLSGQVDGRHGFRHLTAARVHVRNDSPSQAVAGLESG